MSVDVNSEMPNPGHLSILGQNQNHQGDISLHNHGMQNSMQSVSSYKSGNRGVSYYRAIRDAQSVQRVNDRKIKVPKIKISQT